MRQPTFCATILCDNLNLFICPVGMNVHSATQTLHFHSVEAIRISLCFRAVFTKCSFVHVVVVVVNKILKNIGHNEVIVCCTKTNADFGSLSCDHNRVIMSTIMNKV